MNTIEYLRWLQGQTQRRRFSIDELIRYRSRQTDAEIIREFVSQRRLDTYEGAEAFLSEFLTVPFLNSLPDEVSSSLTHVVVGLLDTYEPNACAIRAPDGGLLVILHSDLMTAISHYNELQWAAARHLMTEEIEQAKELISRGHRFLVDFFRNERRTNRPSLPSILAEDDFSRAEIQAKTMANELFVVAHEFAHIYLGHLGTVRSQYIGPKGNEVVVQRYIRRQQMELDADVQAVKWLANLYEHNTNSFFLKLPSRSVSLCIEIMMLLHIVEVNSMSGVRPSSHPPALVRLNHILENCGSRLKPDDRHFMTEMIRNASYTEDFKTLI